LRREEDEGVRKSNEGKGGRPIEVTVMLVALLDKVDLRLTAVLAWLS